MPRPAILHALSVGNETTRGGTRLVLSSKVTSNSTKLSWHVSFFWSTFESRALERLEEARRNVS